MISRIQAFKYRCFNRLDIKVGDYHVLAGANGTGKSTLLDIPLLLGEILSRGLIPAFFVSINSILFATNLLIAASDKERVLHLLFVAEVINHL